MTKSRQEPSPEKLDPLRRQVREWRQARKGGDPMPAELWDAAIYPRDACACQGVAPRSTGAQVGSGSYARMVPEPSLAAAATSSWQTRMAEVSLRPMRRYRISHRPAGVSKYQAPPFCARGIGVGQL